VHYTVGETLSSLFAQDDYRLRSISSSFGLRYDRQSLTATTTTSRRAWASPGIRARTRRPRCAAASALLLGDPANTSPLGLNGPTGFFSSPPPRQLGFPTSLQPLSGFPAGRCLRARHHLQPAGAPSTAVFDVSKLHG